MALIRAFSPYTLTSAYAYAALRDAVGALVDSAREVVLANDEARAEFDDSLVALLADVEDAEEVELERYVLNATDEELNAELHATPDVAARAAAVMGLLVRDASRVVVLSGIATMTAISGDSGAAGLANNMIEFARHAPAPGRELRTMLFAPRVTLQRGVDAIRLLYTAGGQLSIARFVPPRPPPMVAAAPLPPPPRHTLIYMELDDSQASVDPDDGCPLNEASATIGVEVGNVQRQRGTARQSSASSLSSPSLSLALKRRPRPTMLAMLDDDGDDVTPLEGGSCSRDVLHSSGSAAEPQPLEPDTHTLHALAVAMCPTSDVTHQSNRSRAARTSPPCSPHPRQYLATDVQQLMHSRQAISPRCDSDNSGSSLVDIQAGKQSDFLLAAPQQQALASSHGASEGLTRRSRCAALCVGNANAATRENYTGVAVKLRQRPASVAPACDKRVPRSRSRNDVAATRLSSSKHMSGTLTTRGRGKLASACSSDARTHTTYTTTPILAASPPSSQPRTLILP